MSAWRSLLAGAPEGSSGPNVNEGQTVRTSNWRCRLSQRVQFGLSTKVRVREIQRVLGPVGRLVERYRLTVDADRQRAARNDRTPHAVGGRGLQEQPSAFNVDALHLLERLRPAAHAHFEREVQQRIDAGTGRPHRGRVVEMPRAPLHVETIEYVEPAPATFEHARADPRLIQPRRNVVPKETGRRSDENGVHRSSPPPVWGILTTPAATVNVKVRTVRLEKPGRSLPQIA